MGVAFGSRWGIAAGVLLGLGRFGATLANGIRNFDSGRTLSLVNTAVFYAVAGAVAGYLVGLLRRAEKEISAARAREDLATTLHDGVLQTLAIIERRSTDQELVRLAREQDRELRSYLFGDYLAPDDGRDLGAALRRVAGRF
jgi:signal transduction histidine kinase